MEAMKIKVKEIKITRGEGPSALCGKPKVVKDWYDADALLRQWSNTAPENGCYDKCDFVVTFDDGESYTGRYDLRHWRHEEPDLRKHVCGFVDFHCGYSCPPHMFKAKYDELIERYGKKLRDEFIQFRDTYDISIGL